MKARQFRRLPIRALNFNMMRVNLKSITEFKKNRLGGGFTLLELLIAISIIAVLTSISLFALNKARQQTRDARRKSDLETIRSALEIYKADCNFYPNQSSFPNANGELNGNSAPCTIGAANVYLKSRPADPNSGSNYVYVPAPSGCSATGTCRSYTLWARLENPPSSLPSYCSSPPSCGSVGSCNYCVTNP
jgi:prepilin-type N-terminal cleavage/methylation domain-containing protein